MVSTSRLSSSPLAPRFGATFALLGLLGAAALSTASGCSSSTGSQRQSDEGGVSDSGSGPGEPGKTSDASKPHTHPKPKPTADAGAPPHPSGDASPTTTTTTPPPPPPPPPSKDSGPDMSVVHGGPGCGLPSAAFCDTFDKPAKAQGRAGELDVTQWSAGRLEPQLPSGNGVAIGIGTATIPTCRAGLPAQAYPDQDTLICDPSATIKSNHLLVACAAQNYGQNSYRIRQPFDFKGRTGKIVFDAEGFVQDVLLGWISVEITEDPIDAPGFSIGPSGVTNDEGTLVPKNAVEFQFENTCAGFATPPAFSLRMIEVLQNFKHTELSPDKPVCLHAEKDKLNHFEIDVSQSKIDVYATPSSDDGVTFAKPTLLFSTPVSLPFSRGYVHVTTHNHATLKYSPNHDMDAWVARWDNVGFDGPVLSNSREYEVPDALAPGKDAWDRSGPVVSVGYALGDAASAPKQVLHLKNVDLTGATKATLALSAWYLTLGDNVPSYVLKYRLNGKAFHDRPITADEASLLTGGNSQGQLGQTMDVPLSDLVAGDNTVEFVTANVPTNYPPVVANIDLILQTN